MVEEVYGRKEDLLFDEIFELILNGRIDEAKKKANASLMMSGCSWRETQQYPRLHILPTVIFAHSFWKKTKVSI